MKSIVIFCYKLTVRVYITLLLFMGLFTPKNRITQRQRRSNDKLFKRIHIFRVVASSKKETEKLVKEESWESTTAVITLLYLFFFLISTRCTYNTLSSSSPPPFFFLVLLNRLGWLARQIVDSTFSVAILHPKKETKEKGNNHVVSLERLCPTRRFRLFSPRLNSLYIRSIFRIILMATT